MLNTIQIHNSYWSRSRFANGILITEPMSDKLIEIGWYEYDLEFRDGRFECEENANISEVLNWCVDNLAGGWWIHCHHQHNAMDSDLTLYVEIAETSDEVLFALSWKGIVPIK